MNEQEKTPADSSVCFGSCQLDVRKVQVWRDQQEVKLTGKAFAVLCHFVAHPGQLVTKDDLFAAAWSETVVSDATLASCIQEVRQALGDDAKRPRYIETVHRRGFRFIETVVSRQEEEKNQKSTGKNQKSVLSVVEGVTVEETKAAADGTTSVGMERKLAAIFSTDVAGYSRLMGDNEEATIRTLTAYRAVISSVIQHHRGRVVDSPGDNLLAEFASVVDAVRCAVAIQYELSVKNTALPEQRQMQFRIGINLGDVIVESERLYGDGVNIAARLESLAMPGGICISGSVHDQIETKLALTYEDLGEQAVKNIAKPVRVYRVLVETPSPLVGEGEGVTKRRSEESPLLSIAVPSRRFRWWQVLLLIIGLVLGGGLATNWRLVRLVVASYVPPPVPEPIALPLPDKPSIVVLPLVNLSGDSSQEYFSDGLTDDLINTLAQFPDLFVIARQSAFTFKGKTIKEQEIGRELGVRYVLAGSVRRADGQVRLNVQLVDATTREQVWAERYDRPFTEIFALQNDLVQNLATTLKLQLSVWANGFSARKATENVEAYDYELRGLKQYSGLTKSDNLQARQFFETALTLDPQYAQAYANVGFTYWTEWVMKWSTDPQTLEQALAYGQKAVALGDFYGSGHTVLAFVYVQKGQIDRALSEMEQAITLQPNLALSHRNRAEMLLFAGRPEEALQAIQQAIRMSPYSLVNAFWVLGWAYHGTEQYAESIVALKRALALNPFFWPAYPLQAFNYVAQWINQQSHDPKILDQAYDAAQNAIALNDAYPGGHTALGFVYLWQKQYDDAITEFERAVALDNKDVCGAMFLAFGLGQVGRVEEAVQVGERALSLKALPAEDHCLFSVASVYGLAGRLEEAAALYLRMLKQFPNVLGVHLDLAAIYSTLGRETEARAATAEVLRLNPQFSLEVLKQRAPLKDPATLERYIAALRKAGLK